MNDLPFVLRVVDLLEDARLRVWLFGGWAEELRGLRAPCEHVDVDFLYPGRDFSRVDRFLGGTDDTRPHKRTFEVAALVDSELVGEGVGRSKKAAEQVAAEQALNRLGG